jgi:hypothetical protein
VVCNLRRPSQSPRPRTDGSGGAAVVSVRPDHHHVNFAAAAFGADRPLAPIKDRRFGAVASSHLGGIGLHLMLASLAPNEQPDAGYGGVSQSNSRRDPAGVETRAELGSAYRAGLSSPVPGRSLKCCLYGGTGGSNPSPSSGESVANFRRVPRARRG